MRTKQTARKSTGGRAPRIVVDQATVIPDHQGEPVTIASSTMHEDIHRLSIQVYKLDSSSSSPSEWLPTPAKIGSSLKSSDPVVGWGNARNWWPRVDVFHTPLLDLDACMAHHRAEVPYRNGTEDSLPHIVPNWAGRALKARGYHSDTPYRSHILVAEEGTNDWEGILQNGLLWVEFDCVPREILMEFTEGEDLDAELPNDMVAIEPLNLKEIRISRAYFNKDANHKYDGGYSRQVDESGFEKVSFYTLWSDLTSSLWDCTYRIPSCEGCEEGLEHENCEKKQKHYFGDDGQCIEYSNFKTPSQQ